MNPIILTRTVEVSGILATEWTMMLNIAHKEISYNFVFLLDGKLSLFALYLILHGGV